MQFLVKIMEQPQEGLKGEKRIEKEYRRERWRAPYPNRRWKKKDREKRSGASQSRRKRRIRKGDFLGDTAQS